MNTIYTMNTSYLSSRFQRLENDQINFKVKHVLFSYRRVGAYNKLIRPIDIVVLNN